MLFQLFKKKKEEPSLHGLSALSTDMHSHLVPGVDDGSDSVETSLNLIKGLISLGYKKLITTPHIRPDYFPNTPDKLRASFEQLKAAVKKEKLPVELMFGAEYYVDYDFTKTIEEGDLLTFSGNHVLIEISTFSPPPNLYDSIFQLRIKGYQPILAHPERYVYYQDMKDFQKLKDFGCLLQLNILSLTEHYGKHVKDLAHNLLKNNLIDLLGTDLHHQSHLKLLKEVASNKKLITLLKENQFQNAAL